jgi:hypothetical protein
MKESGLKIKKEKLYFKLMAVPLFLYISKTWTNRQKTKPL